MLLKMLVQSVIGFGLFILLLFLPAGTLAWPEAWIFLGLFGACSLGTGLWLRKTDPELLVERSRSPLGAEQKPRDRVVIVAILLSFCAWLAFMALDARRFAWSVVPSWAEVLGAVLILAAFYGWITVLRENSFASVTVRLQADRGQRVVSTGPYAVVRHPMYAYALLLMVGTPLLLGSLWGLAGLIFFVPLLAARVVGEEAMLAQGLPGYREYTARVRFRLLPGVW